MREPHLWTKPRVERDQPGCVQKGGKSTIGPCFGVHKCLSCGKPLLFAELVIDHVIPEATTSSELNPIIEGIGLRHGFDIYNCVERSGGRGRWFGCFEGSEGEGAYTPCGYRSIVVESIYVSWWGRARAEGEGYSKVAQTRRLFRG